jgi:hemerythrin
VVTSRYAAPATPGINLVDGSGRDVKTRLCNENKLNDGEHAMSLIQWTDQMSVGHEILDEDHQVLVGLLNRMHDAKQAGAAREKLCPILDELIDYAQVHFAREETLFDRLDYANAEGHKRQHAVLTKKAGDLRERFSETGAEVLGAITLDFLKNWLQRHILVTDMEYARLFEKRDAA